MKREISVASITVATNAAEVLSKQLDALISQSFPLDEIVVVDNGSTDSTVKMVRNRYPQVTVIELGQNLGVGGAFSAGLSYAGLDKKYDWIWLFDEDSVPENDGLEQLLKGYALGERLERKIGVVACAATHGESGLSYPGLLWRERLVLPPTEVLQQAIWFVDGTISSGTMVRREVVENVGLPRADFFMDFVDFEYSLRIRRHGYEIAIVRDSVLHHTLGIPRVFKFLGYKKAWSDHAPWRQYYIIRNHTYVVWYSYPEWRPKLFMLLRLARHGTASLLFSEHGFESLRMMLLGFLDGRAGKLGIRFVSKTDSKQAIAEDRFCPTRHASKKNLSNHD
jgi:GT2 family glycosyltransferase